MLIFTFECAILLEYCLNLTTKPSLLLHLNTIGSQDISQIFTTHQSITKVWEILLL